MRARPAFLMPIADVSHVKPSPADLPPTEEGVRWFEDYSEFLIRNRATEV